MEALGIDIRWFVFQLLNFILLMAGLTYLLHKPLIKLLDSRKEELEEQAKLSAKLEKEREASEKKQEEILEKAREESRAALQQAKEQAVKLESQLKAEAQEQASQILEKAKAEIESEQVKVRESLQQDIAKMVMTATERVLENSKPGVTTQDVDKVLSELKK